MALAIIIILCVIYWAVSSIVVLRAMARHFYLEAHDVFLVLLLGWVVAPSFLVLNMLWPVADYFNAQQENKDA